jgi:hypothetical protein
VSTQKCKALIIEESDIPTENKDSENTNKNPSSISPASDPKPALANANLSQNVFKYYMIVVWPVFEAMLLEDHSISQFKLLSHVFV